MLITRGGWHWAFYHSQQSTKFRRSDTLNVFRIGAYAGQNRTGTVLPVQGSVPCRQQAIMAANTVSVIRVGKHGRRVDIIGIVFQDGALYRFANAIMRKMIQIITKNHLNQYYRRHPLFACADYLSGEIISVD